VSRRLTSHDDFACKKRGVVGYFGFLYSCVPSIVAAYSYPSAISWVTSFRLVAVLTVYCGFVMGFLGWSVGVSVVVVGGFGVFISG